MTAPAQFILCKGTSGMGNRILAACNALLYARMSNRALAIDWRDGSYSASGQNAFPLFFNCPNTLAVEDIPRTSSVYPEVWRDHLDQSFGRLKQQLNAEGYADLSCDVSRLDYPQAVLVFGAYTHKIHTMTPLFTGPFASLAEKSWSDIIRSILMTEISPTELVQSAVDDYQNQHFSTSMIGVHVRFTDLKIPVEKIIRTVEKIVSRDKESCIFLATDSQAIIEQFQSTFDQVITTHKWFPPAGERMHQNWDNCPDRIRNGVEALTDLYLLAACDRLVFSSQSSFGYVASLLSQPDTTTIYDVSQSTSLIHRFQRKVNQIFK